MRASILLMAALLACMITACANHGLSQMQREDARLRQKLIGDWRGSASLTTNEVIQFHTTIRPDGTFTARDRTYDDSGRFIGLTSWGGIYVVSNRAVVCTITETNGTNSPLPRTIQPEPIVRVDDREMEIINESGIRILSRKVSR